MCRRETDRGERRQRVFRKSDNTAYRIIALAALLSLPGVVLTAFAGVHPVPLEKGTDTPQCLECHEDKGKGKHVHPAIDMGCLSCHVIRISGETTRVNLKTAKVANLCFECHADKNAAKPGVVVHAPAKEDCLKCHDAHTSANEQLLRKQMSGGKDENLCLGCHNTGLTNDPKGSHHAAVDMGCNTCHVTHKVGKHGAQELDFHLAKPAPDLCTSCHDTKDAALSKVHKGQPFEKATCTRCHDPHESSSPKLMQKFVHMPFSGGCDDCHQPAKDGKVVLTQTSARGLCVTCHDTQAKQIETAKVQHPGAQGECTDCHNPHAGTSPQFLQPNRVAVCETCHTNEAEIHDTKRVLHDPVYKQGCDICHMGHGGEHEHLIRADANELCTSCHDPKKAPAKAADSTDITIFDGAVRLPENYFDNISLLRLDERGFGHPQIGHPVGGVIDPSDPQKLRKITCVRCHNPHGGGKSLLAVGEGTSKSLCSQCHANLRTMPVGTPVAPVNKKKGKR